MQVADPLRPTEVAWSDGDDDWTVVVEWGEIDGRVEAVGMHLRQAAPPQRPVTAVTWRRVKVGQVVARARRQRYEEMGGGLVEAYRAAEAGDEINQHLLEEFAPGTIDEIEREASRPHVRGRGRPPEYDDAHFAKIARIYSEAVEAGLKPLQAVITTQHVSKPTASRWVARARELGMLSPTTPGKVSPIIGTQDGKAGD